MVSQQMVILTPAPPTKLIWLRFRNFSSLFIYSKKKTVEGEWWMETAQKTKIYTQNKILRWRFF